MTLVINPAVVGCHYFLPGQRLPSQLQSVTALAERPGMEPSISISLVPRHLYYATTQWGKYCRTQGADPEAFLAGGRGVRCAGTPYHRGMGPGEARPYRQKNFTWKGVFWGNSKRYFVRVLARKMMNFPPEEMIWSILHVLWEVVSRFMWLVSFLLHYNASNLVVEILKHDKIWLDNLH